MTYDSLFGGPTERMPEAPTEQMSGVPRRSGLVAGIVALVLALACAAAVAVPQTRLIGLGAVPILAVPLAIIWRRERGSRGFVLASAALGVLCLAFAGGFVVTLVSGMPERTLFGTPSPASAPAAPAAPPVLSPGAANPPAQAPDPIPDAIPTAAAPPPVAPQAPTAPQAPAKPAPAVPTPTQSSGSSGSSGSTGEDSDEGTDDEQGRGATGQRRHPATPRPNPSVGKTCEPGPPARGSNGESLVCAPVGGGEFAWRRSDSGGYGGFWGGF